jgi:hypothetical protein
MKTSINNTDRPYSLQEIGCTFYFLSQLFFFLFLPRKRPNPSHFRIPGLSVIPVEEVLVREGQGCGLHRCRRLLPRTAQIRNSSASAMGTISALSPSLFSALSYLFTDCWCSQNCQAIEKQPAYGANNGDALCRSAGMPAPGRSRLVSFWYHMWLSQSNMLVRVLPVLLLLCRRSTRALS